jgi:hypothetical protein
MENYHHHLAGSRQPSIYSGHMVTSSVHGSEEPQITFIHPILRLGIHHEI